MKRIPMKLSVIAAATGTLLATLAGGALAAEPADWSKVESKDITLFYPGTSALEWVTGRRHGGGRAFTKGDSCADCHADETADMGAKIVGGEKLEPSPIPGKAAAIPVKVQAAHDGEHLYLRFSWQQPPASAGAKLDEQNPIKIAFMLDAGAVDMAERSGCWASCHGDSRTMPEGEDSKKKYVKDGSIETGVFYDLAQWRSGENKAFDGYVAETRVMEGGTALVGAEGKLDGDTWNVVFTRKLAGGKGDVSLEPGKTYNFGFAIHDSHSAGRYHHVSLGYSLGLDAKADITAAKH